MQLNSSSTQDKERHLNALVAVTVVILSVFMGIAKIKDDNIVQTMQLAKSDAVDSWSQYQAKKIKYHLTKSSLQQANLLIKSGIVKAEVFREEQDRLAAELKRYESDSNELQSQAKAFEAKYDALNFHDDQFDMSDATLAIALAMAAVAALTSNWSLLLLSWCFGSVVVLFGLAGFLSWPLHPDWLATFLS